MHQDHERLRDNSKIKNWLWNHGAVTGQNWDICVFGIKMILMVPGIDCAPSPKNVPLRGPIKESARQNLMLIGTRCPNKV